MPHPRKHLKLTGDTHPPEVEDDLGPEPREPATAAAPVAEGASAPAAAAASRTRSIVVAMPARQYVDFAREQVRARPLATAAGAFFAGFVLAVVTRSR
jgi:hypothetical protein